MCTDIDPVKCAKIFINQELERTSETENLCYIYRVYDHLRNLNKAAYEPQLVAIGPYHHGTPNTKLMEKHKMLYLKSFLERQNADVETYLSVIGNMEQERQNADVETYLSVIGNMEQEARACYAHHIDFGSIEFISMMLLDGCFIIELLLQIYSQGRESMKMVQDPILSTEWMLDTIQRDLMLFENQIPFFVLQGLYDVTFYKHHYSLINLISNFFESVFPDTGKCRMMKDTGDSQIIHLLHWIHSSWRPSSSTSPVTNRGGVKFIASATKLRDANVTFEKNSANVPFYSKYGIMMDPEVSSFDVKFHSGTLKMTPLTIEDRTEALFRNLIAFEQYFPGESNFVTDYVKFLDCLIDSPEDVDLLREHDILDNRLGNDTVVSDMFNKLTDSIFIPNSFSYVEVCDLANEHRKNRTNTWKAMFKKNHLSSPWAIISVIYAVILLLLTIVQTVCSILQV